MSVSEPLGVVKNVKMARRLTFAYFSVISFIIILIHFSVYYTTFESIEQSLAKDRFNEVRPHAEELLNTKDQDIIKVSPHIYAYRYAKDLPDFFKRVPNIDFDEAFEIHIELDGTKDVFYMKTQMMIGDELKEIWLLNHKDVHDFNRDELFFSQKFQMLISLSLLAISLLAVQRVSVLLTEPLYKIASQLRNRPADDHSPMPMPSGMMSQELEVLVNSLNQYQQQIIELIERERAFNQHASHELRTPLMVIKGSLSLLKESNPDEFSKKQYLRLDQACDEINEFVSTLLALTREGDYESKQLHDISRKSLLDVISQYEYLIEDKAIEWQLESLEFIRIPVPLSVLKILFGNLIKNAFSYTEEGNIKILANESLIRVADTGVGLELASNSQQGFGLGLVIVKDICRKYGFEFTLVNNEDQGCIADIRF